jgi:hypothetical protein
MPLRGADPQGVAIGVLEPSDPVGVEVRDSALVGLDLVRVVLLELDALRGELGDGPLDVVGRPSGQRRG